MWISGVEDRANKEHEIPWSFPHPENCSQAFEIGACVGSDSFAAAGGSLSHEDIKVLDEGER